LTHSAVDCGRIRDLRAEVEGLASDNDWAAKEIIKLHGQIARLRELYGAAMDGLNQKDIEAERLRTALQGIADNPDPLEGKCYCRWSQRVARQALDSAKDG
jgi:chromosome segregation ATPase